MSTGLSRRCWTPIAFVGFARVSVIFFLVAVPMTATAEDRVIYAADIPRSGIHGGWYLSPDGTAAADARLMTDDQGFAALTAPSATPTHYVDVTFSAEAGTPYTLWLRLQAQDNSKWNDAVWVQYSDALAGGIPVYRIGSTAALVVNLATDGAATSLNGWGWQNTAYWVNQHTTVTFASSGTHTLRIQVREDGVQFDQIVLSSSTYLNRPPGSVTGDTTVVAKPAPSYVLTRLVPRDFHAFRAPTGPHLNASGATILVQEATARTHAYYASASEVINLGTLAGGDTIAHALNDAGMVVGVSHRADAANNSRAFVWTKATGIRDLAPANPGLSMSASGINNRGDVVGTMCCVGDGDPAAFLYTGGNVYNLNSLNIRNIEGWDLREAALINDEGVIIGRGTYFADIGVFLLTPIK